LRILFCSHHYLPLSSQPHLLPSMLQARGHEVRVLTTGQPRLQILDDVLVHRFASKSLSAAQLSAAVIGQVRFAQIIHLQQALPPALSLLLTARTLRKPLVIANQGGRLPFGGLALRALRRAAWVALSEEAASEMRAQGIKPRAIIPNGVELPPGPLVKERLAVFAGRLESGQDLELLRRAAGLLRDAAIDEVSKASPLSRARVFVLPSKGEGASTALLEAMAHGCACVATSVGGNRALLADGAGVLVAPGDPKALAREIQRLLDDPEAAANLGDAARTRVLEKHQASAMVEEYERLYESL
jgi:hypothetical protein